jgi:hypothetical protein
MKPFGNTTGAPPATLGDDLLHGAEAIAVFVFGNEKHRRKVYHYAGDAKVRLPVFRIAMRDRRETSVTGKVPRR